MAAVFFARLPAKLAPAEVELRDLLRQAAIVANRLLPCGEVSLQEWVNRRIPTDVVLSVNALGQAVLELPRSNGDNPGRDLVAPASRAPQTGTTSGSASTASKEAFFQRQPVDAFSPQEEQLRVALTSAVAHGPAQLSQVAQDLQVRAAIKALLPKNVPLVDWIERRVGAEILVVDDDRGQQMVRLACHGKEEKRETFFASLPMDSFTPAEEMLRSALVDFLAMWKSKELATLSHAGGDKGVQQAKCALLPQGVTLRDWIERRIGGEMELSRDMKGQYVIRLTQEAGQIVNDRYLQLQKLGLMPAPSQDDRDFQPGLGLPGPEGARLDFFDNFPENELLPQELTLRQALMDFMQGWSVRPGALAATLSDAGQDKAVQQCRMALLPKEVALKEWIERRIGGEILTRRDPNGQVQISVRGVRRGAAHPGTGRRAALPAVQGIGAEVAEGAETDKDRAEAAKRLALEKREAAERFFDSLPADGFTAEEETLRLAILNFLEQWKGPGCATLSSAGGDVQVRSARAVFLPRGGGISLREWIDRRIGGEVETHVIDAATNTIAIGLPGLLDVAALTQVQTSKKRKTDSNLPGDALLGMGKAAGKRGKPRLSAPASSRGSGQGAPWSAAK